MRLSDLPFRESDMQGAGYFGAPRGGHNHRGVDMACSPGTEIHSPVIGEVTKIGLPYPGEEKSHIHYVEITSGGYKFRVFYVSPTVQVGAFVYAGTVIGYSQELGGFYPGITEHVHFEIKNAKGDYIDPTPTIWAMRAS